MEIREGLLYAKSHEWVKEEGGVVTIGLTDYAQSELGDLVFVNLPEEGDSVSVGEAFGDVESVKLFPMYIHRFPELCVRLTRSF